MKRVYSLVLKDFIIQKNNLVLLLFFLLPILTFKIDTPIIAYIIILMGSNVFIMHSCIIDDNKNNTFFLNSLPYERNQIVKGKFIATIMLTIILSLWCLVIINSYNIKDIILTYFICSFFYLIYFPIYYKYDAMKANNIYMILMLFPILYGALIEGSNGITLDMNQLIIINNTIGFVELSLILVLALCFNLIAYILAVVFYKNKEF